MSTVIATILSSIITGLLSWMITSHKSKAEIEKLKADTSTVNLKNLSDLINVYKVISEDLKKEVVELKAEVSSMKKENIALRKEITWLQEALQQTLATPNS